MFDLDTAIGAWRKSLVYKRSIMKEDLDELERHIRDEVEIQVTRGLTEEDAFRRSVRKMGSIPVIDSEYKKIYWGKISRRRKIKQEFLWRMNMLKSYIVIALRLLVKQRVYAFINVFGLAVGIAFSLMLLLYIQDELNFDSQHENADRIARIVLNQNEPDGSIRTTVPWMPFPLGKTLQAEHPSVQSAIRMLSRQYVLRAGDISDQEGVLHADPEILTAFSYPLVEGFAETALPNPDGLVISERIAEKYFGEESPVGQTLEIRFSRDFVPMTVTGVVENIPRRNSVHFDVLMPFEKLPLVFSWVAGATDHWNSSSYYVYFLMKEGTDMKAAEAILPDFRKKYFPNDLNRYENWTSEKAPQEYAFQPLKDIHLNPNVRAGLTAPSNPMYSWILGGIALTILLLACINFTTLAIGRSASRSREVGLRKVVGAAQKQLVAQFGGEAVLMSLIALVLGLGLVFILLPTFSQLADKDLVMGLGGHWAIPLSLLGLTLLVATLSGFYPTMVLAKIRTTDVLRKQARLGGSHRLTKGLIVLQFTLSVGLIAGTTIMTRQMNFLQTADVGYDRDHVVLVPTQRLPGDMLLSRFQTTLEGVPEIEGITGMTNAFSHGWSNNSWNVGDKEYASYIYRIESNFLDVMDIDLLEGRAFDPDRSLDSTDAVIVNEAFVREYGWDDPIGMAVEGFGDEPEVVGVVQDINFLSLHEAVSPMMFILDPNYSIGHILFQVRPDRVSESLEIIREAWAEQAPGIPFRYSFLDDDLAQQYANEKRWSQIVQYASLFAIVIACLGLFGLASLSVSGRTKEIGVRRVMGASVPSLAGHLSKEFLLIVGFAVILAVPITLIGARKWLENFAYHIDVGVAVFVIAAVLVLSVALITVSFQTIRAANANPVDSLRSN